VSNPDLNQLISFTAKERGNIIKLIKAVNDKDAKTSRRLAASLQSRLEGKKPR